MYKHHLLTTLQSPFIKPFSGLNFIVWLFWILTFCLSSEWPLLHGHFYDPDDTIHAIRIIEWFEGQSWFDPTLYRLGGAEGVISHFSRLAELPMMGITGTLHTLGLSWQTTMLHGSLIYNTLLFFCFLSILRWAALPLLKKEWAGFTAYVSLFSLPVLFQFAPGRLDHHNLSFFLMVAACGALFRLIQKPKALHYAILVATFLALAQAIALETLPFLLLLSSWLGWRIIHKGGQNYAHISLAFGTTLYLTTALFLLITHGSSHFFDLSPTSFSYLYLILTGTISFVFVCAAIICLSTKLWIRFVLSTLAALSAALFFFAQFPDMLAGPYGGMDIRLNAAFLHHINEVKPPFKDSKFLLTYIIANLSIFFGLFASIFLFTQKQDKKNKLLWGLHTLLIGTFLTAAIFYQKRYTGFAALFCILPLSAFFREAWLDLQKKPMSRKKVASEILLLFLVGPLFSLIIPAIGKDTPFKSGLLLFPPHTAIYQKLPDHELWSTLNKTYGDAPRLIMNSLNEGSAILFYTNHKALSAPYHTNVQGNLWAWNFFSAENEAKAKQALDDSDAELILLSTETYKIYNSKKDKEKNHTPSYMAYKLLHGNIPSWLKPVQIPLSDTALLFEKKD